MIQQQPPDSDRQKGQAGAGSELPSAQPLPSSGTQATPGAGQSSAQPGQVAPPPTPRPPAGPPGRNQPARAPQPSGRPATDAAQQIQFDTKGLVTMHTNELDVRQLLELLSRRSGMNILVSPRVTGTITANFEGVTVEKVLKAIIKLANLVDKEEGAIHYIYSQEEVRDEAEFTKKERILTKVYKLSYVRADEILGVIRPFLSRDVGRQRISVTPSYRFGISEAVTFTSGGAGAMGPLSGGGGSSSGSPGPGGAAPTGGGPTINGFQPPTGGNSISDFDHLIIQDYESNLKIIDQIIQRIDVRPIQVLIEAVIVSVDYEHDRELGVNLGLVDNLGLTMATIGSGTALNGNVGFTPTKLLTTSGTIAQPTVVDGNGFTSATNGVKFGFVTNNVTGFIRALETIGNTKILASPRILVLNKQRAEIQLGTRLGFQTLSQNFTSTIQQVQFLNTGTLLRLRPFVSDDGMVRMEIHPERSSGTVTNNIPNQSTAELTTNVMVPDGATLVIGGLIEDEDDYTYQGLPGLSRWPALGFLTGVNQKTEGRRELVVLLTPHIWSPDPVMAHALGPHSPAGAFGAAGPVASSATTFDLETGKPVGGAAGAGSLSAGSSGAILANGAAPGLMPEAPAPVPVRTTNPPEILYADPARLLASCNAPSPAGTSSASSADHNSNDQSESRRRRWPSLRAWMTKKLHGKEADPASSAAAYTPPAVPGPVATATSPTGVGSTPSVGESTAPRIDEGPSLPGEPGGGPAASPQQPSDPNDSRPYLDIAQPPAPTVDAAMSQEVAHRDPMLTQAAWTAEPIGRTHSQPLRAEPDSTSSVVATGNRGIRPGAVVAGPRRHTIAEGETLASISRLYYGSDHYAEPLRKYNRGRIPRSGLRSGELLVIPPREELAAGGWVVQTPSRAN
jgi:general secretion pathway protein D